jgi:hypothetical protein
MAQAIESLGEEFTDIFASPDGHSSGAGPVLAEVEAEAHEIQCEHELLIQATINGFRHQTAEISKDSQGLYAWLHSNDTGGLLRLDMPPGYPTKLISVTTSASYGELIDKAHDTIAMFKDRDALTAEEKARRRSGKTMKLATVSLTFLWSLPGGEMAWTKIGPSDSQACQKCLKLVAERGWKDILQVNFKEAH